MDCSSDLESNGILGLVNTEMKLGIHKTGIHESFCTVQL